MVRQAKSHGDNRQLAIGNWQSLLTLFNVWQCLVGCRSLRRMIEKYGYFSQLVESGSWSDENLVWLGGRAVLHFHDFSNVQTCGVYSILTGRHHIVACGHFLETWDMSHF